jgi:hypothetical protein
MALGSDRTLVVDGWDFGAGASGTSVFFVSKLGF